LNCMRLRRRSYDLIAAAFILLSGALSAFWAFVVPIFQAGDEPAHFDYAISIYSAGRLIRVRDGVADWIASPYTRYLMRAADLDRIMWRSSERVPSGYGSRAYFARVDAAAPSIKAPVSTGGRISYVVTVYPFAFYALEALWMHVIALFTNSLVVLFFSARLLCVFLMMAGLYFTYRAAGNLGIPGWLCVALVAITGLFPLTTLVSSYVQPDNLTFALVAAALFFATGYRHGCPPMRTAVGLGIVLGLLAVTKYHFFVSVSLPVLCLVAVRFWISRGTARYVALSAVALLAPTVVLAVVQHWVSAGPADRSIIGNGGGGLFDYYRGVLATGPLPTFSYTMTTLWGAFIDFFVTGASSVSYWAVLGALDTPLVIVDDQIQQFIRAVIEVLTLLVTAAVVASELRNLFRLAGAARRGHTKLAVAAALGDPVFNSYVCFTSIMLALYVITNDVFTGLGRNWYPYVPASFLCALWYAPKALKRLRRPLESGVTILLGCYVVMASIYALGDVIGRYYGASNLMYTTLVPRPAEIVQSDLLGVLLRVEAAGYHVALRGDQSTFQRGARLRVRGIAIFPNEHAAASKVAVVVDHRIAVPTLAGQYSYVIAENAHNIAYGYSGFDATMSTRGLDEGPHVVSAYARIPGSRAFAWIAPEQLFFLAGPSGRFSAAFIRSLERAPKANGSIRSVTDCGSRLVVTGSAGDKTRTDEKLAVWVLLNGRPYPAHYTGGSLGTVFESVVPTVDLAPGSYNLGAYEAAQNVPRNRTLGDAVGLRIALPGHRGRADSGSVSHNGACTAS
jgi:hypothetical protein